MNTEILPTDWQSRIILTITVLLKSPQQGTFN